jgi:hypothetical protein
MTVKEAALQAIGKLPDTAGFDEIVDLLISLAADRDDVKAVGRLCWGKFDETDAEYYRHAKPEVSMDAVLAELRAAAGIASTGAPPS